MEAKKLYGIPISARSFQVSLQTENGLAKALQRHVRPTATDLYRLATDDIPAWHGGVDLLKKSNHSPDEPGCTCRDQWKCPACGHWHRYGGVGRPGRSAQKAAERAAAIADLDPSSPAAAELRPLLQPVLDEMAQASYKAAAARSAVVGAGDPDSSTTKANTPSEPAAVAAARFDNELEGRVCDGCGTAFPTPPPPQLCPFVAREQYYRGVGVRGGAGVSPGGPGNGGLGNDVVIKVQVKVCGGRFH